MPFQKEADEGLLRAALIGYQRQRADLEERIADIRRQLGGNTEGGEANGRRTRVVSAAGRRRMAEAQKKRWAVIHEEARDGSPAKAAPQRKKRKMSAAGRARIAEATRKRWAAFRAEKSAAE